MEVASFQTEIGHWHVAGASAEDGHWFGWCVTKSTGRRYPWFWTKGHPNPCFADSVPLYVRSAVCNRLKDFTND